MNVKRFTAKTSRDALALVRQAFGDDAVVLSTKPSASGVEVLAMAPEGMLQVERMAAESASVPDGNPPHETQRLPALSARAARAPAAARVEPALAASTVDEDSDRLTMSTLSFQDYVRDRMLKRRRAALRPAEDDAGFETPDEDAIRVAQPVARAGSAEIDLPFERRGAGGGAESRAVAERAEAQSARASSSLRETTPIAADHDALRGDAFRAPGLADAAFGRRDQDAMLNELRSMKGLIEERFGALAFMEKLQRQPAQARLTQKLLDCGYSPALIRKLAEGLPADTTDETAWAQGVLERNLASAESETALEEQGGVYALVGATGVGKTTTTAKIAAAFAARCGASNLGLITLDAYRIGAHEQLRAYGRILGVPVHTAHDRASLEDLLDLLTAKKMVLIDTAGMAQRDARTRELLDMLSHRSVQKLLVVNAASQGETIEDVLISYRAASCAGVVLSKMDEAVKLGPALDALIRHKLKVVGVANGQRVPEDWHRLSANALVHRSLRSGGSSAWRLDPGDVSLIFTALHGGAAARTAAAHA
jgi:flagellar biosynthesis protein FlhF